MISLSLPLSAILYSLSIGVIISFVYLGLLWQTVKYISKTQRKALFLLISALVRLALFLYLAVLFSEQNPARFLWIVAGFIITRICFVSMVKLGGKNDSKS